MSNIDPYTTPPEKAQWDYQPAPQTYGQPRYAAPSAPTNNLAVASLVLGILWVFWIGSALAVIFGHIALKEIKRRGESGQGLAVAGLVLGYVGAGTFVLFFLLPLMLAGSGA